MKPYYERNGIAIYHGDCRQFGHIVGDMAVVTDPPYGIGYVKGEGGRMVTNRIQGATRNIEAITGDDTPFDPRPWCDWEYAILWGANHFCKRLPETGRWIAWNKLGAYVEPFDSFSDVEFAWYSRPGKDLIFSLLWKGVLQDDKANNGKRWHPTQKPEALMRYCIGLTPVTHGIFDPFMGSGTTLVSAKQTGRVGIGIEIEERYCEIAAKRLEQTVEGSHRSFFELEAG